MSGKLFCRFVRKKCNYQEEEEDAPSSSLRCDVSPASRHFDRDISIVAADEKQATNKTLDTEPGNKADERDWQCPTGSFGARGKNGQFN
jgi:hypothetical protein